MYYYNCVIDVTRPATIFQKHSMTGDKILPYIMNPDDVIDIDTHRTGGLLELSFPDGSKIVVNTQPPLHELWMAARSGGFHYKYVQSHWADTRDGRDFFDALSACASEQAGKPFRFSLSA